MARMSHFSTEDLIQCESLQYNVEEKHPVARCDFFVPVSALQPEISNVSPWAKIMLPAAVLLLLFSPSCRVFTTTYFETTVFLGYIILQLFCS